MERKKFWAKIDRTFAKLSTQIGKCRVWVGAKDRHGYGRKMLTWPNAQSAEISVHRLAYMRFKNLLPHQMPRFDQNGHTLDVSHLCHNTLCIRPDHLTLEKRENNLDRKACAAVALVIMFHYVYFDC